MPGTHSLLGEQIEFISPLPRGSKEVLSRVSQHDYLGVTISHDLRWDEHHRKVAQKASRTLGLIRRTLSPCSKAVKAQAYLSLVRPQLEYASDAWNPYTKKGIAQLEQVQRSAARFVHADYRRTTSVTPLISDLGWESLHNRRLLSQLKMFYKIQHGLVKINLPANIHPASHFGRHDHHLKYQIPTATIDPYKYSYFPRTVRIWNQLPPPAVMAPSIVIFQTITIPAIVGFQTPSGSIL